jgi:glucose/arabinose dehydrogenase
MIRSFRYSRTTLVLIVAGTLSACHDTARLAVLAGTGPAPQHPAPVTHLIPTTNVAKAIGWTTGSAPTAATELHVSRFAEGLDHPRWLYVLPNGDVLAVETNGPPRPDDEKGIKAFFKRRFLKKAGGATVSADRITLLRDANGDGIAETRTDFLSGLTSPFGVALIGSTLYVANTDAIVRFPYVTGETRITTPATRVVELPAGPRNHHWTKSLLASADGSTLYVGVGSNSNAGENGIAAEAARASIWAVTLATGQHRELATGLRNPVGMTIEPESGALWAVVNERDELGPELVPDYLTSVREGSFYGWPYAYWGPNVDRRVQPQNDKLVQAAVRPDFALQSHSAPLGLSFVQQGFAAPFAEGAFIGLHGSWNRDVPVGYKVIFVPFANGRPSGPPVDFVSGFQVDGKTMGRPVGVTVDPKGALIVADDLSNTVWRVTPAR